jgi:hypothetical protein
MTAAQLAESLGISRALLFKIRGRYPKNEHPANFDDVEAWRSFIAKARTQIRTTTPIEQLENDDLPSATESNIVFVAARARQKVADAEIREIELAATRRELIAKAEIIAVFGRLGSVLRGRLLKARNDLPTALLGLNEVAMDAVLKEKFDDVMGDFILPGDFWSVRGVG